MAETLPTSGSPRGGVGAEMVSSLRSAMSRSDESERYRLLAVLFGELADQSGGNGRDAELAKQIESLSRRLNTANEEKAGIQDLLAEARANLDLKSKQLDAEQARAQDIQARLEEQRLRREQLQKKVEVLETDLTAKIAELHKAENKAETLELKFQRADLAAADTSRVERLEAANADLARQLEAARLLADQLRAEKNAEIARLTGQVAEVRGEVAGGGDTVMAALWERLARVKPPMVEGHVPPNVQSFERMVDMFIQLAAFARDVEQDIRPILEKYTKHGETVRRPWQAYAAMERIDQLVQGTLAVKGGKPVGVMQVRLRELKKWLLSALYAGDIVVENIGPGLNEHLLGPGGAATDPNRRIRDYIKQDGHLLFQDHIRELCSQKLAETYAHWSMTR